MPQKVIDLSLVKASCQRCGLRQLCLPQELDSADVEKLDGLVERHSPLQRGEYLFRQADSHRSLFAIRSGSFKTQHLHTDGTESILGFHLPGEIIGFDGLGNGEHQTSAIALERSTACELPLDRLQQLATVLPSLDQQLHKIMGSRISEDQEILMVLRDYSAQARLCTFLLNLARRLERRGLSSIDLLLSMTRQDVANFLGLTLETVSRTFAKLEKEGVVATDRRNIRILDNHLLVKLSGTSCEGSSVPSRAKKL